MAITLASDALSDAEITDGIGQGDLEAAARLWVRHWPTALTAAREYVGPDEVPGLAAEALIATVSAIAIGRGPREDVDGFVIEAVRELGEDDEPAPTGTDQHPPVFVSPMMTTAFAELDPELQETLRASADSNRLDDEGLRALTVLQHYYLAEHTDKAETKACRRAHIAMMSVADSSATEGVPGATWLHMSTCAWCTEAFHEVSFSNVALGALIDPSVLADPVVAEEVPAAAGALPYLDPWEREVTGVEDPALTEVAVDHELVDPEPVETEAVETDEPAFVEPVFVPPAEPFFDGALVPEEDDEDEAAVVAAAHVGSRRGRLIAVGIAAAAAVSVVAVILVGNNDTTSPTAAGSDTSEVTPTDDATSSVDTGSPSPTEFATVAGPRLTPTATATKAADPPGTAVAKPTTAAPKPTKSATSAPSPTSAPTTAQPTPDPTPTPSPTATPTRCNALQRLFGLC
jgi:hypothetical protein